MKLHNALIYSVLTLGIGLTACEKKPETAIEKLEDKGRMVSMRARTRICKTLAKTLPKPLRMRARR